ncbi:minor capsid protein [Sporosarcina saromensis]|uniref:Minor capsid protein n=1 Tax=Sporosarcina saromensis TaxID=359365 RepID=A0ABU4G5E4_9BACL|nr:minor capsid protein [Sporosarcina saromensis]MDW0112164.1 minor capsid protein [Sporosarcina saromensis]
MAMLKRQIEATSNPFAIAEIEKLVKQGQIHRLTSLLAQIDARLISLGHTEQMDLFSPWLSEVYLSTYYRTGYTLAKGTGMGMSFTRINERAVIEAITYPWSGQMFSERIWFNRGKLVRDIRQIITNGLIRGSSVQRMSRELKEKMNSSYKNSLRLIRTETAEVLTSSTAKGYEEYGVEEYQFLATLDNKTSSICRNLDMKIFKVKEKQAGVNASPMHPSCRSAIAPYFDGIDKIGRWSNLPDGEKKLVKGDISYDEWYSTYVT